MLAELDDSIARGQDRAVHFAELKDPVKDKLKQFGLFARLGEETFFPTVGPRSAAISRPTRWSGWTGKTAGHEIGKR